MKSNITKLVLMSLLVLPFGMAIQAHAATPATFDASGSYVLDMNYLGNDYEHSMTLAQNSAGDLTGGGGSPAVTPVYTWVLTSGSVHGNVIDFLANYTATADAVTPLTTMHVVGTIATSGAMSGTWTDNYQGGSRSGTWKTTSGVAAPLGSLSAEDFGVVSYDTGLGMLKGYTAGFGLTDATFAGAQLVVVKLYSGTTLLQTNTSTAKVTADITGTQISTPFDVSGTFDYATDGYWTNSRESEYGQTLPATKVVATVVLSNGKTVTATNTNLVGDPSTIFGTTTPPVVTHPVTKNECKNGGWKTFTDPSFKNQGQCVSYVEHAIHGERDSHNESHEGHHDNDHANQNHKENHGNH
jgi:hypothetical protein